MKSPFFSIIVPVYNIENFADQAVKSILKQNFDNYEIILINDGSTDCSGKICDSYSEIKNISVIHQKNGGLSRARNSGIKKAIGQYLVFLDGDDKLEDNALQNLYSSIVEQKYPQSIICRRKSFDENTEKECSYQFLSSQYKDLEKVELFEFLQTLPDFWFSAWMFSVERKWLCENNIFFYEGIFHEDEEWVPRLFFLTEKFGFNNEILICYRENRIGSITATPNIKRIFDKLLIIDLLQSEFQDKCYMDKMRKAIHKRLQCIYMGILCDTMSYAGDKHFEKLLSEVKKKMYILHDAVKVKHRMIYFVLELLGVKVTCRLLYLLRFK